VARRRFSHDHDIRSFSLAGPHASLPAASN
jgi:hypothetical protein